MAGTALVVAAARRLGATMLEDTKTHEFRMHVRSETSSNLYVVSRRRTSRQWECACMGWIRHRRCKHLTAMVPVLEAALSPRRIG
jgi:hypothetical protein